MFDGLVTYILAKSLALELVGSRVDKIYEHSKDTLYFSMRGKKKGYLVLSSNSSYPSFYFSDKKPEVSLEAPIFCMFLRKYLTSAKLISIETENFERIVYFNFECKDLLNNVVTRTICLEIMGKHSNIILIEDGIIKDAIKRINQSKSSRQVMSKLPFTLPPVMKTPFEKSRDFFENLDKLQKQKKLSDIILNFSGFSRQSAKAFTDLYLGCDKKFEELTQEEIENIIKQLGNLQNTLQNQNKIYVYKNNKNDIEISAIKLLDLEKLMTESLEDDINSAVKEYFTTKQDYNLFLSKKHNLLNIIEKNIEKTKHKIDILQKEIKDNKDFDKYQVFGEILLVNNYNIKPYSSVFVIDDYIGKGRFEIPLDPKKNAIENANLYFKKYQKSKKASTHIEENIKKTQETLEIYESILASLENSSENNELEEIKHKIQTFSLLPKTSEKNTKKSKKDQENTKINFITHLTSSGKTVLVGRNSVQNDILTFKVAKKNHIWLHVKDIPGSHTILVATKEESTTEDLVEAAKIAAKYSKHKYDSKIPVDYTEVKYVKKSKGGGLGNVTFTNNKTLYVD